MLMEDGRSITYISTLASSNSSRAFSLVGCHIGISKYLTRKGQTTLSRTKNKKNLPQREMRNKGIDITKTMGWNSLQKSGQSHHPSRDLSVCRNQHWQNLLNRVSQWCLHPRNLKGLPLPLRRQHWHRRSNEWCSCSGGKSISGQLLSKSGWNEKCNVSGTS